MSDKAGSIRLNKAAKELGVGTTTILDFLSSKGVEDLNPTSKLSDEQYDMLLEEFADEKVLREAAELRSKQEKEKRESAAEETQAEPEPPADKPNPKEPQELIIKDTQKPDEKTKVEEEIIRAKSDDAKKPGVKVTGKLDLDSMNQKTRPSKKTKEEKEAEKKAKEEEKAPVAEKKVEEKPVEKEKKEEAKPQPEEEKEDNFIKTEYKKLEGAKVIGKMDLPEEKKKKPVASSSGMDTDGKKKKRKRIKKDEGGRKQGDRKKQNQKEEISDEEIQKQVRETLARLSGGGKSKAVKYRREKREERRERQEEQFLKEQEEKKILKVTEFVSANELANMMSVAVNDIISACMSLGLFVSINQRLDAETISIVAEEFGYTVEFVSADVQGNIEQEEDKPEDLVDRPPIVTVMGHVDHGKTSLLDYVRKANVIAGEAGGITQHIGAYGVELEDGRKITFLDTPGHEAFTAMRARGAQVTDVVIIVVAADDSVMPQTVEAINHAQAAGVPIVIAINKIDKPGANPDKIKEELANMNILVEDWGGKYQCAEISAKKGTNINDLLEKVLLEAELLELKANPSKNAVGTVIESELDKGRGYVATILVEGGTLRIGDILLAGCYSGRVKALFNERGNKIESAGPATPALVLGLSGAPQSGDKFNVMDDEKEAREIAARRLQLQREQGYRAQKHITLDEIGRRLAIGDFRELNLIVKGDVDGSVEALSDSLIKLSTDKIQVNIVLKGVGAITESDVLLASASDAVIVGFQVRPSVNARKLAEKEQIDIRLYSVIYDAINEIKQAMEGMLAPEFVEKVVANIEIREVFKISKVGTVAGCMVLDGKINRNTSVRVIRDGIVVYTGELGSLKRFKDDVKEVAAGYECGLNIKNFNDIKVGDIIEGYEEVEVQQKL